MICQTSTGVILSLTQTTLEMSSRFLTPTLNTHLKTNPLLANKPRANESPTLGRVLSIVCALILLSLLLPNYGERGQPVTADNRWLRNTNIAAVVRDSWLNCEMERGTQVGYEEWKTWFRKKNGTSRLAALKFICPNNPAERLDWRPILHRRCFVSPEPNADGLWLIQPIEPNTRAYFGNPYNSGNQ